MGMVDSQPCSSKNRAVRLALAMRKRKRRKRLNWFPLAEAIRKCTLIQKPIYVLLKNRLNMLNFLAPCLIGHMLGDSRIEISFLCLLSLYFFVHSLLHFCKK